jgi:stage V sporulation protein R
MYGSPVLIGDNTVPGVQLSKELKEYAPKILQACRDWGLDFYPTVVQLLTYDEISEIAAYGGFPVRFPHWSFGMEYEELQRGYMYGLHKIYEMVVNCCALETKILTKRGTINAGDVKAGDFVYGKAGWRKVALSKRQKNSETLVIKLKDQIRNIVCTPNHKWYVSTKYGYKWVETKNIKKGDMILGVNALEYDVDNPCKINFDKNTTVLNTKPNIRWCLKDVILPKKMTEELAEIIGVILGDGNFANSGPNQIEISVGLDHEYYAKHVAKLFHKVFNKKPAIYKKKNCFLVSVCSKYIVDYFEHIGMKRRCNFNNKEIPWSIWSSSQKYRVACLKGLFDTDGCCSRIISFSSKSLNLVKDIQLMLSEIGIYTSFKHVKNKNNNIYSLKVKGRPFAKKFSKLFRLKSKQKIQGLKILSSKQYCSNRGFVLSEIREEILNVKNETDIQKLNRTLNYIKNNTTAGSNCLYSFCEKAEDYDFDCYKDIKKKLEIPHYEVEKITKGEKQDTVDIALFHDDHDFVAEGLMTHNTNPCYIYCLSSNSLLDNLTVIAHATGHNDFFKNNIHFSATDTNMLNKMANHGTRIRNYMARWGKEKVLEFIDWVMRIDTLIDGSDAWSEKVSKNIIIQDQRTYNHPKRLNVSKDRLYMDPFINTKEFKEKENQRVQEQDIADEIDLFKEPTKNILGFLRDNAPLKPWQSDIISMLYDEAIYFFPQRQTKVLNEGWASMTDSVIMAEQGYVSLGQKGHDHGIVEYAEHKMGVLGGKYSTNPYKLGYYLLSDIRERWDKGRFGSEWEDCTDMHKKENWDLKTNLGKEKMFEVRKYYNDLTLIHEFFTEDFCRKQEYFHWVHYPNGEFRLENRDYKKIKKLLMQKHINGGLPDIRLSEPNYRATGAMMLEHTYDGRTLYEPYVNEVLIALRAIWGKDVYLSTKDVDGNEKIYCCYGTDSETDVEVVSREEHSKNG